MEYSELKIGVGKDLKVALVTGATGLLGSATSLALARQGWKVALLYHNDDVAAKKLLERVHEAGGEGALIKGDLLHPKDEAPRMISEARHALGTAHLLVHAASLPVATSSWLKLPEDLEGMFTVHVTAYMALVAAMLPEMLRVQTGVLVGVLSQAMLPPPVPGWQAYTIAKAALAQAINELAASYGSMGIRSLAVLPGALKAEHPQREGLKEPTARALRSRWPIGLEAEKTAELILDMINNPHMKSGTVISIDGKNGTQIGRCHTWLPEKSETVVQPVPVPAVMPDDAADDISLKLRQIIRDSFGLEESLPVDHLEIGNVEGWDSLGHIKLMMEVESAFDVRFDSTEVSKLTSFSGIVRCLKKYSNHPDGKNT